MKALVGYTGFVGSNIYEAGEFDRVYNSKNITEAFGTHPDVLVYAGIRAEKYMANAEPQRDLDSIYEAEENISRISPKRLILISTIDVLDNPYGTNEDTEIDASSLQPYGANRLILEKWVRTNYPDALIVRLPGLFGKNIKKNFIYDLIKIVPSKLRENKIKELSEKEPEIMNSYTSLGNGFYQLNNDADMASLKTRFEDLGFTAVNFTDSRSRFQFYDLSRLWNDIVTAMDNDIRLIHMATEPVSAAEIYHRLKGTDFINEISDKPADYDFRTKYGKIYGSNTDYLTDKETVLKDICSFIQSNS